MSRLRLLIGALAAAGLIGLGAWIGHGTARTTVENAAPAPAVRQDDGSIVAARREASPAEKANPPHQLPKGAREVRRTTLVIKPKPAKSPYDLAGQPDCEPVTVHTSLVDDGKGGYRVVGSAEGGEVVSAEDLVIRPLNIEAPAHRWAAGVSMKADGTQPGAWVERDLGRIRAGAEVLMNRGAVEARLRIGVTF